jgi:hypothetical protein
LVYTGIMRLPHSLVTLPLLLAPVLALAQEVPRPAGEFAIGLNSGGQILLSQYSGKVVLLAFLYTT